MIKKRNFLFLLLMTIIFVGCTNIEEISNNKGKTESQEVTTNHSETEKAAETEETPTQSISDMFPGYRMIKVDGGDLSGHREPNVVVDIGFGDRQYWAFTNEYGQLVRVIADEIILQDERMKLFYKMSVMNRYYQMVDITVMKQRCPELSEKI